MKKIALILLFLAAVWPALAMAADPETDLLLASADVGSVGPNKGGSQTIGDEDVEPKDVYMATIFSILPGIVFHGSGNYYAGDYNFGTKMLVMEIFGGGISIWGYNIIHQPQHWGPYFGNNTPQAGYWIEAAGVAMLCVSWVGDVATAAEATESWNKDHQLEFQMDTMDGTGARLTLMAKF